MPDLSKQVTQVVGRRIAAARREAGLTHAELAARLGWPRDTLIHYEHGRRAITVDRLEAIAAALDLPPASFLIDDATLSQLIVRLLRERELQTQVQFFLNTLESDQTTSDPE
jgi:transcriptional regulator with XRE-family HTH domain